MTRCPSRWLDLQWYVWNRRDLVGSSEERGSSGRQVARECRDCLRRPPLGFDHRVERSNQLDRETDPVARTLKHRDKISQSQHDGKHKPPNRIGPTMYLEAVQPRSVTRRQDSVSLAKVGRSHSGSLSSRPESIRSFLLSKTSEEVHRTFEIPFGTMHEP